MARDVPSSTLGGVLKDMYGSSLPSAAVQLMRDHAKQQANSQQLQPRWGAPERTVKHVDLKIPRVGRQHIGAPSQDRSHLGQRRSYASIRAMTQDYQRQDEPREPGKDGTLEKRRLQDRHAYGFGNALPTSKAPPGHWLPEASVPSVPASAEQRSQRAQETLAADIVGSVRERQQELASVEETLTKMERGPPVWRHRDIAKMNSLQKRRMDLRNGITRDVKDLEKFIELTN